MTLDEARSLIGCGVVYRNDAGEAEAAVITCVLRPLVSVRCRGDNRLRSTRPENLTLPGGQGAGAHESLAACDPMAASQAALNEIVAGMIRSAPGDCKRITMAVEALRRHNWAAGFGFEGVPPEHSGYLREHIGGLAVSATLVLESQKRADAALARLEAKRLERDLPHEAAALMRQLKADAPALVYVVTHAALGAAKIGVSDAAGSRIAQHRRAGWQLLAAFQVAADAACAIEDDVLQWWRHDLGLPPFLNRGQMPQGGWTETVVAGAVDLAATVAHVCELALLPDAKPAA